ncbi:MAG: hypothetical protein H7328_10085 [Bdellovibrio sp.]|nr:hypothetical protein [Bdellovibrio sp.]
MKFFNLITTAFILISFETRADIFSQTFGDDTPDRGQVIVERPVDITGSYKERRGTHGGLFSINYEKYNPLDYASQFLNGGYIENITSSTQIDLVSGELGYKNNFKLGSAAILLGYARGSSSPSGDASMNKDRKLTLARTSLSANFALDAIFDEPYLVPYVQGGIYHFNVTEKKAADTLSATSDYAFNYRFGVLFQLNWIETAIDSSTQTDGLRSSGLQNTYIDIYYVDHLAASGATDPAVANSNGTVNMRSAGELGVGLKIEF